MTFTNKAAGEMKHRIGRLLDRDPSGLWIGTFHSLSARLLRREAELLGFTRQFTIYDEDDRLEPDPAADGSAGAFDEAVPAARGAVAHLRAPRTG